MIGGALLERKLLSEAEVIKYMKQICEGMKYLHENNILHLGMALLQQNLVLEVFVDTASSKTCSTWFHF